MKVDDLSEINWVQQFCFLNVALVTTVYFKGFFHKYTMENKALGHRPLWHYVDFSVKWTDDWKTAYAIRENYIC